MLRLTLRSARDGRYLARVIDQGTFPFVLDFGDKAMIADVSQRLQHGFTMWRWGRLVTVPPRDPEMLQLLAEAYAGDNVLVFVEEPNWGGRASLEDRLPGPSADDDTAEDLPPLPAEDDPTEVVVRVDGADRVP